MSISKSLSGLTSAATIIDVIDYATSQIALPHEIREWWRNPCESRLDYLTGQGSKLGIDAMKKFPGEGFKRAWPPLIRMDENVRRKIDGQFGGNQLK